METIKDKLKSSWMHENEEFDFPSEKEVVDERIQTLRVRWDAATNVILSQSSRVVHNSTTSNHDGNMIHGKKYPTKSTKITRIWFDRLIEMHTKKERSYHTLCHLEEMFGFIDLIMAHETASFLYEEGTKMNNTEMFRAVVDLSVFFHDCVYNAKSSSNEEESAQLFMQFVGELLNCSQPCSNEGSETKSIPVDHVNEEKMNELKSLAWEGSTIVRDFILATKSHSIDQGSGDKKHLEQLRYLEIFLDSDMAVLGKNSKAYNHYASLIRKEYAHVEHDMYCEKRADILESFIGSVTKSDAKKNIYLTASMRDALEDIAVANLRLEIASLRNGVIPGET